MAFSLQATLEDISYLLRIPQRKPYGTMEGNVKKALKVANANYSFLIYLSYSWGDSIFEIYGQYMLFYDVLCFHFSNL